MKHIRTILESNKEPIFKEVGWLDTRNSEFKLKVWNGIEWKNISSSIPDNYITEEILTQKGYITNNELSQSLLDKLTKEQADEFYQPIGDYALKENIPDVSNLTTKEELNTKQDTLVSGKNIKTINGQTVLGGGDITIESGSDVGKIDPNSNGTGEIFNNYEGNKATGNYSHAEGNKTKAEGANSHAEGDNSIANGPRSHAEGYYTTTSGISAHAEGYYTTASGRSAHAEGNSTKAKGFNSHAQGYKTTASGDNSHASNIGAIADNYAQTSIGCFNENDSSPSPMSYNNTKPALLIGNGRNDTSRGNAFKVLFNGQTFADGEYSSAGADYAECFEWKDANLTNEDRVGRFVTLDGDKIRLATATDTYILGIISGAPTIIGDNPMRWQGKYLNDEWGRPIYEDVEVK